MCRLPIGRLDNPENVMKYGLVSLGKIPGNGTASDQLED